MSTLSSLVRPNLGTLAAASLTLLASAVAAGCAFETAGEAEDLDLDASDLGSTVTLVPTSDVAKSAVIGVGSTTQLWANVDDGSSSASGDGARTIVRASGSAGYHTVGYSGAPAGAVQRVVVSYQARHEGLAAAVLPPTARVDLYDGSTLVRTGQVRKLGGWLTFTETFDGLSVATANTLRTTITFSDPSGTAKPQYTQIWLSAAIASPTSSTSSSVGAGGSGAVGSGGSTTGSGGEVPAEHAVRLPIEVLGSDGYVASAIFELGDPEGITHLQIHGHRLGYVSGSPKAGQTKASVRLNGGAWRPITNATASVDAAAKSYGGIGGAHHTVRATLPISGAVAGENVLEFRFEGTDGETLGYRILDFNLLAGSAPVLPAAAFARDDPADFTAPDASSAAKGKALWYERGRLKTASGAPMRASCGDCHAHDARDLRYFNYSNRSIAERSKFHGLSAADGAAIASYVRSLGTPAPASARPWNPPYQPGPGLDARPASEWSAGAGLESVLDDDEDMLAHLVPSGSSLGAVASTKATLNAREMPVAVQFPDWNAWLPSVHPLDVWGDYFLEGEANDAYASLRADLPALVASPTPSLATRVGKFDDGVRGFVGEGRTDSKGGGHWRTWSGTTVDLVPSSVGRERAKSALAKWMATKHWEIAQEFGLEALPAKALPPQGGVPRGEARGWPSDGQSVWAVAPHMVADDKRSFVGQSELDGLFQSSVWYQVQMTVNAGMRLETNTTPMDWAYHFRHMMLLANESGRPQALRYAQSMIKAYQMRDNGLGPALDGWQLRFLHPWQSTSDDAGRTEFFEALDAYEPSLRKRFAEAMLASYLDLVEHDADFAVSQWPRRDPGSYATSGTPHWFALESASYAPKAWSGSGDVFDQPNYNHADAFYRLVPRLKALGVSSTLVGRLKNWCAKAWPAGSWSAL